MKRYTTLVSIAMMLATAACEADGDGGATRPPEASPVDACFAMAAQVKPSAGSGTESSQGVEPLFCMLDPGNWGIAETGEVMTMTDEASRLMIPLIPSDGETLLGVDVVWSGAGGHGDMPAIMPTVVVHVTDLVTLASQMVAEGSDPSVSPVEYQTPHRFSAALPKPIVFDTSRQRAHAVVSSEYGDGAVAGGSFIGLLRVRSLP